MPCVQFITLAFNRKRFVTTILFFLIPGAVFGWTRKTFQLSSFSCSLDICDQDREPFMGHIDNIMCLCPEISYV